MSNPSNIRISQVYDPRISVQNTILNQGSESVNFVIDRVSDNTQFTTQSADTTSNGQLAWNNITIDPNQGLSSLIVITTPVRITFTAQPGSIGTLINDGTDAPRSSLFMKNDSNISLGLNSSTLSESTRYYMHALAHYGYNYDSLLNQFSFTMRSCIDNDWQYNPGANNNVLGTYENSSVMNGVMARGAYKNIQWKLVSQVGVDAACVAVVDILYTDVVPISPLNISDYPKYCIPGVNNLTLQVNMNPQIKFLWSHSASSTGLINESGSSIVIGSGTNTYGNQATMYYQLYSIPQELTSGIPPALCDYVYPYYYTNNFITPGPAVTNGSQVSITTQSITPQGIPKYIYVWAEIADSVRDVTTPYWFLSPQQITVNFGNKQNTLTSIVPVPGQPFNVQLYTYIAAKNGCRDTMSQFLRTPVMCISPEDLNLDPGNITGMSQQSTLTIVLTVQNNSGANISACTLNTTIVYEGAIMYSGAAGGGRFTSYGNIVSPAILREATILSSRYYHVDRANRDYLGGLSMSSLLNSAKNIGKSVVKGVQTALPYVKSGISAAEKYLPVAAAAVGAGFVAGQRMDRGRLQARLSNY